ncbi:EAL domain-containing protein [Tardiphaga sp.]|uniref:bifunctional diguanylate cyclase/phosphodiesterase n=1 Tax=Tardiphaga sp. TaxID=1926292 RepID=UPI002601FAF7|nr:EAL domain-containing protein [Tardiphaga sp.]
MLEPIKGLILCGGLLITAIVIGTVLVAIHFRDRAIDSSKRELENTVLLVTRHFDQQFDDLQGVQNDVVAYMKSANIDTDEAYKSLMSGIDVHRLLRAKLASLPYMGGLNLFDAEGRLINSSEAWPVPDISVADRSHFQTLQAANGPQTVLAEPVISRVTGAWTAVFARKLVGQNDEFLGMISRGVEPVHFENFFASLALGKDATIAMIHRNGTVLARYPRNDTVIGQNLATSSVFRNILASGGSSSGRYLSPIDGEDQLASARRLSTSPILIVATNSMAAALNDWREQTRLEIFGATLAALVIFATLFLIVRQLIRQHRAAQQMLAQKSQHLDTAIDSMTQGLVLFDANARLVVCNQRFIDMFGVSTDVVKPGCHFRDLIRHRQATGTFVGDAEAYCTTFLRNAAEGTVHNTVLETPDGRSIQILYQKSIDGGWASTLEDITERRRSEQRIAHLAHYDALTDLPNRVMFRQQMEREIAALPDGAQFAILYIDIDEFKGINDSLGHAIGDELLKIVATRLRDCVGASGFVARLGGDEFAIVQTAVSGRDDVIDLVAGLYAAIRQPCECLGHQISTDASIGIAIAPGDGADLDQLLRHADLAMYGAKADGRRNYRFFEPAMDASAKARRALELDLRRALAHDDLEIHYQPLVDIVSNEVTGCEALLRWRHPVRGMISPAEFIPVAEETGLIAELGEWVLRTACAEAATWPVAVKLAVNVSPVQFKSQTLALKVVQALAASGLPANRLELEITEAVLIRDDETALAILHQLRAIGVRIALDDFGTGYSSLSYLQRFPFDKIKIDRCFIKDLSDIGGSSSIVQAVVTIANARHMDTTAEGVETQQQLDLLRTLGCTQMQGWLFSAAKPAAEIRALLRRGPRVAVA